MTESGRLNRLAGEQSPYLLQHARNPVDWHPWGEEAFAKARREDKPLFVSVGYSACHWCHVMERESFADGEAAAALNDVCVPVKVDREERPDVDGLLMAVAQVMNGSGGWPLNVLLTPDGLPFFAAAYLPKRKKGGAPGLLEILPRVKWLWRTQREQVERSAGSIRDALVRASEDEPRPCPGLAEAHRAYEGLRKAYDREYGGFSGTMKFPMASHLLFLIEYGARTGSREALAMVDGTLTAMWRGGIRDHLGGGLARYTTDREWRIPHFEKMLYDQALVLHTLARFHEIRPNPLWEAFAADLAGFILGSMTAPGGGFWSAFDADSGGEEGAFYLWTPSEIRELLPPEDGELFSAVYGVTEEGNFGRGTTVLRQAMTAEEAGERFSMTVPEVEAALASSRAVLRARRAERPSPLLDDKILTDWNGLAIAGLSRAGVIFSRPGWVRGAEDAAAFLGTNLVDVDGGLLHRYRGGRGGIPAFLDDYAFLAWGLAELHRATGREEHARRAADLLDCLEREFGSPGGGCFLTREDPLLFMRRKEAHDGALPSGNAAAMTAMGLLGDRYGKKGFGDRAAGIGGAFAASVDRVPMGHTHLLAAVLALDDTGKEDGE